MSDVNIIISKETTALTQAGFGLPLIVGTGGAHDYALCADLSDVDGAGFGSGTAVYAMAQAVFGQNPSPPTLAVVGVVAAMAQAEVEIESNTGVDPGTIDVSATAAGAYDGLAGNHWRVVFTDTGGASGLSAALNTTARIINVDFGGDVTATADEVATEINGLIGFDCVAVGTGTYLFTAAVDANTLSGDLAGGTGGLSAALDAVVNEHDDWYFLLTEEQGDDEIAEIAAWAAANKKLYFACPDETVADTIVLAAAVPNDRTALIYHSDPSQYPDAAWVGEGAVFPPGSQTWKFKTLANIPLPVVSRTEVSQLHAGNVNTYVQKYGVSQTSAGLLTSGEYIDVTRKIDFVEARLNEALHGLLFTARKIPYTPSGIAQVGSVVRSVLNNAFTNGIISEDNAGNALFTVTTPDINDIPTNDKANRHLPDVRFSFVIAGAIESITVLGTITL